MTQVTSSSPQLLVERLPFGWETARVIYQRGDMRWSKVQIINQNTKICYFPEPMRDTAFKCFLLLFGTPIYLTTYVGWHFLRTPITAAVIVVESFFKMLGAWNSQCGKQFLIDLVWTAPKCIADGLWTLVRAPFYALAMEFAALYGVFKPLEGRAWVGEIEKEWHQNKRGNDVRHIICERNPKDDPFFLLKALGDKDFKTTCFLAFCMQPLGKASSMNIQKILEPGALVTTEAQPVPD